jgi:hypothetical protein
MRSVRIVAVCVNSILLCLREKRGTDGQTCPRIVPIILVAIILPEQKLITRVIALLILTNNSPVYAYEASAAFHLDNDVAFACGF